MAFAYYRRLSAARKATYRRSDAITSVLLPAPERLQSLALAIGPALAEEIRGHIQEASQNMADELLHQLGAPAIQITILEVRPSDTFGELHGLYEPSDPPYRSRITVWMRTARRKKVVAFRTFLRTLLHELLHHLDYEIYELPETFHTEGFYKRESSLFHQIISKTR